MASQPRDDCGVHDESLPAGTDLSAADLEATYRQMVLARVFDDKAVSLSRQGRIGTYAPLTGQEAAQVGAATALGDDDYCLPTYRDHGLYLARDVPVEAVLRHLAGRGNYVDRMDPEGLRTFPPTIPIATQLPHAVGLGMAADYRDDERVALVSFGDGATSEGDFHEAMNFAGVFDAPVVFLCQNNGYAISTDTDRQTAAPTLARKAGAYGFEGVRVDGNDLLAVHGAVSEAVATARDGGGPTMVEAVTYRRGPHTTTDDPGRYRDDDEVAKWADRDPIDRTREWLASVRDWTDADDAAVYEWAEERVASAVENVEAEPDPEPDDFFEDVYAAETRRLRDQRRQVAGRWGGGDSANGGERADDDER